jgi:two-component system NtrC family sensor kinase
VGAPPAPVDERDDVAAALPGPSKTILVVDDEPAVASLLAETLARDGHKVDTAANGAVALRMLGARDYDLIVSDSGMPVLRGPELYREVERREPRLTRRFVFATGDILNPRTRAFLARTGAPSWRSPSPSRASSASSAARSSRHNLRSQAAAC